VAAIAFFKIPSILVIVILTSNWAVMGKSSSPDGVVTPPASETKYWIEIMIESEIVSKKKMSKMLEEVENIIKILTSIINKLKAKE
jgi:hypothetical protein